MDDNEATKIANHIRRLRAMLPADEDPSREFTCALIAVAAGLVAAHCIGNGREHTDLEKGLNLLGASLKALGIAAFEGKAEILAQPKLRN